MWLTIVLERHLLPGSKFDPGNLTFNVKIRFNAPWPGFAFQQRECTTPQQEFLWKKFYSARIKFSPRMLSRFCFPAGFSPGSWRTVFSWRDPGEYRFLGEILAEIRGGNFSREGSRRENGPPRWDPGERRESWRDPGKIPVPILQG